MPTYKLIECGTYEQIYYVDADSKEEAEEKYREGYAESGETYEDAQSLEIEIIA